MQNSHAQKSSLYSHKRTINPPSYGQRGCSADGPSHAPIWQSRLSPMRAWWPTAQHLRRPGTATSADASPFCWQLTLR